MGGTVLVQEKIEIFWRIKLGVNGNPPFYQCPGANALANDARFYAYQGCAMQNQGIILITLNVCLLNAWFSNNLTALSYYLQSPCACAVNGACGCVAHV